MDERACRHLEDEPLLALIFEQTGELRIPFAARQSDMDGCQRRRLRHPLHDIECIHPPPGTGKRNGRGAGITEGEHIRHRLRLIIPCREVRSRRTTTMLGELLHIGVLRPVKHTFLAPEGRIEKYKFIQ